MNNFKTNQHGQPNNKHSNLNRNKFNNTIVGGFGYQKFRSDCRSLKKIIGKPPSQLPTLQEYKSPCKNEMKRTMVIQGFNKVLDCSILEQNKSP